MDTLNKADYNRLVASTATELMNTFFGALYTYTTDLKLMRAAALTCVDQMRKINNEIISSDPIFQTQKNKLYLDVEAYLKVNKWETETIK